STSPTLHSTSSHITHPPTPPPFPYTTLFRSNGIEDSSKYSGLKFLAALNGTCAGGGYEMALACDEIAMVDDRSSTVSLPEVPLLDRKSTRLNSSHLGISYAVFCLKKKNSTQK